MSSVDVVFTWVDGQDYGWQIKYKKARNETEFPIGLYADDEARFENHNELYYSVCSVLNFMPWVRKIFIVTDNQIPKWYDAHKYDKVHFVYHQQIIDKKFLPTFNSHVIESCLYKIPDLSENFIYFNDDVFVARALPRQHFFANNDIASIFVADKSLSLMESRGIGTPTLFAMNNSRKLLNKTYGFIIDMPLVHTYVPLKKSYYEKAWSLYGNEIIRFLPNKFRSNNDLNLATFLVPWLMYIDGKSSYSYDICYYFNIRTNNAIVQYRKLLSGKLKGVSPHSFCANDFYRESKIITDYQKYLDCMLSEYFDLRG